MKKHLFVGVFALLIATAHSQQQTCQKRTTTNQQNICSTFGMIKPDAVAHGYAGDIIKLIEQNGFTIERMHKRTLSQKDAEVFYAEHQGKPFFKDLVQYITSGPIIGLELKKVDAITDWRTLIGATDPSQAQVGTLRKMFATSKSNNAVHGSDSTTSAQRELKLFFNS